MNIEKIRQETSYRLNNMIGRRNKENIVDDILNLQKCLEYLFHDLGWISEQITINTILTDMKEELLDLPKSRDEFEEVLVKEYEEGYGEGCRCRSEEDYEEGYEEGYQKGLEEANKNTEDSQ